MARRTPRNSAPPDSAGVPALLWAPWRSAYVTHKPHGVTRCIFCFGRLGAVERRRRLVLYAGPLALVMLNRYPYNNGHLMVAPRRHVASLELLTREECDRALDHRRKLGAALARRLMLPRASMLA